ncbi:hypothetical protein VTL71DRAFT_15278 [Oculimacula yallundae]|uniref:C2H2-type domain-containing protein n=1 Tax=Oculimacula yallundae TaxID=86028 RepID=A0ABR4CG50_9HELO
MASQTPNLKQRHRCTHSGCSRSYLRVEHLNRHRLTHQEPAFLCYICKRPFTRNDLLQAHITRQHKDSFAQDTLKETNNQQHEGPLQLPQTPPSSQETHQQAPAKRQITKPGWDSSARPFAPPGEIDFGPAPPYPPPLNLSNDVRSEREQGSEPLGFPLERVIFGAGLGGGV